MYNQKGQFLYALTINRFQKHLCSNKPERKQTGSETHHGTMLHLFTGQVQLEITHIFKEDYT